MIRISTPTTYYVGSKDISALQVSLQIQQAHLSTQRRVNQPSDDPVAFSQIQLWSQSRERTAQFVTNSDRVESSLATSENALSGAIDLLSELNATMIQAGNGALNDADLLGLQRVVAQNFAQLLSYANMTDGKGQYLFSGNKVDVVPFVSDANLAVTYEGDSGQRSVEVTDSCKIAITDPGLLLFGGIRATTGLFSNAAAFDAVKDFHDLLASPPSHNPNYTVTLSGAMADLSAALSRLVDARSEIGSRRVQNSDIQNGNAGQELLYKINVSQYEDLDLPAAISAFTLTNISLEYSKEVYSKITKTSLIS